MRKKRNIREILIRYVILIVGLFIMALGVALSTKADLGTSPISCVPYVLSLLIPFTMGEIMFAMLFSFVILQIILLRKDYEWLQLTQLIVAIIFSIVTDITMKMVQGIEIHNYILRWVICMISFFFVALGIFIEVKADVSLMAGDGLIKAISKVSHCEFSKVKIFFDSTLTIAGAVISFIAFYKLKGVREGTIAAAIIVGMIVRWLKKNWTNIDEIISKLAISDSVIE